MVLINGTYPGGRTVHSQAQAFWTTGAGEGEFRTEALVAPAANEVLVRTRFTGISRGTESLVARGEVPASEGERMRAPFQGGEFPFPVKYGYLNVGTVEEGPEPLEGATVFSLVPHQSSFVVPVAAVVPVPRGVPARRAVLAGAVETAVNILWDAAPRLGDRIVIVGAGMIGASVARLAQGIPGASVTLVDVDPAARELAERLEVGFAHPDDARVDADVVIEASGSPDGLQLALRLAPTDGEVLVASWFGSRPVPLELGGDFHSRRLTLRSSQVGAVAPARRSQRTTRQRLELALRLLADPRFDALLGEQSSWRDLPEIMAELASGGESGRLCHTIDWTTA